MVKTKCHCLWMAPNLRLFSFSLKKEVSKWGFYFLLSKRLTGTLGKRCLLFTLGFRAFLLCSHLRPSCLAWGPLIRTSLEVVAPNQWMGVCPQSRWTPQGLFPPPRPLLSSSSPDLTTTTYVCFSLSSPPPLPQLTKLLSFLGWINVGGFSLFSLPHRCPSSHPVSTLQPELYFKDANQII